eukprot:3049102-Rhodomonas_salina.2
MATTSAGGTVVIRDVLALVDDTGSRDEFNALNEGLSVHLPGQNTWTGHHMIFIVTGDTDQDMAQHWIENWIETVDAGQPVGGTPLEWEVQSWVCAETAMVHLLLEAQQREREQDAGPDNQRATSNTGGRDSRAQKHSWHSTNRDCRSREEFEASDAREDAERKLAAAKAEAAKRRAKEKEEEEEEEGEEEEEDDEEEEEQEEEENREEKEEQARGRERERVRGPMRGLGRARGTGA